MDEVREDMQVICVTVEHAQNKVEFRQVFRSSESQQKQKKEKNVELLQKSDF